MSLLNSFFRTTNCVVVYKILKFYGGIQGDWGKKFCFGGINKCSVVTPNRVESHFSHKDTKARRKFKGFEEQKIKKLSVYVP